MVLGRYIGPHVSKYAQNKGDKIDYHIHPSGKKVIKAFVVTNFLFYNMNNQPILELTNDSVNVAARIKITWRI